MDLIKWMGWKKSLRYLQFHYWLRDKKRLFPLWHPVGCRHLFFCVLNARCHLEKWLKSILLVFFTTTTGVVDNRRASYEVELSRQIIYAIGRRLPWQSSYYYDDYRRRRRRGGHEKELKSLFALRVGLFHHHFFFSRVVDLILFPLHKHLALDAQSLKGQTDSGCARARFFDDWNSSKGPDNKTSTSPDRFKRPPFFLSLLEMENDQRRYQNKGSF